MSNLYMDQFTPEVQEVLKRWHQEVGIATGSFDHSLIIDSIVRDSVDDTTTFTIKVLKSRHPSNIPVNFTYDWRALDPDTAKRRKREHDRALTRLSPPALGRALKAAVSRRHYAERLCAAAGVPCFAPITRIHEWLITAKLMKAP